MKQHTAVAGVLRFFFLFLFISLFLFLCASPCFSFLFFLCLSFYTAVYMRFSWSRVWVAPYLVVAAPFHLLCNVCFLQLCLRRHASLVVSFTPLDYASLSLLFCFLLASFACICLCLSLSFSPHRFAVSLRSPILLSLFVLFLSLAIFRPFLSSTLSLFLPLFSPRS